VWADAPFSRDQSVPGGSVIGPKEVFGDGVDVHKPRSIKLRNRFIRPPKTVKIRKNKIIITGWSNLDALCFD
jgi:hypothetical protein